MPALSHIHHLVYVAADADHVQRHYGARLAALRDEGFFVRIATPYSAALDRFAADGFDVRPLPGAHRYNVVGHAGALAILQGEFLEYPPTLVHGFGRPWAWVAAQAARHAGTPAVFATVERHRLHRRASRLAYRALGQWVSGYFLTRPQELDELLRLQLLPPDKLELLHDDPKLADEQVILRYDRVLSELM